MKIFDCHVHIEQYPVDTAALLKEMDKNGVERIILFSKLERKSFEKTRENIEEAGKIIKYAPDRLSALAWVNPTIPGMMQLASEAITDMGLSGLKITPDHWFAFEKDLEPFWEAMNQIRANILFHTGILYGFEDGSRFCHPVYLEKLIHYPSIRFVMAHVSWPWCEECLALMGRMRAAFDYDDDKFQSYIDITPGIPPHIRRNALHDAIDFCGAKRLMFGTDTLVGRGRGSDTSRQKEYIENYMSVFEELNLSGSEIERIMSGTAADVFNLE